MPIFPQMQQDNEEKIRRNEEAISMPFQDKSNQELIKWQLDISVILTDIENRLSGKEKVWNPKLKDFQYKPYRPALLNEEGIARIMTLLRSAITPNLILSYFEKEEANTVIIDITLTTLDMLYMKWEDWGVQRADLTTIRSIVENGVKITIFRSLEGKTMEYLRNTAKQVTTFVDAPTRQQPGFLRKLGGLFRW